MSCHELIAKGFALRTAAHLAHLQSRSHAEHVALSEFYDGVVALIDQYAETYQGAFGLITDYPSITPPTDPMLASLVDFFDWVKANRSKCALGETTLENILDEVIGLTARTIYKLRYLK